MRIHIDWDTSSLVLDRSILWQTLSGSIIWFRRRVASYLSTGCVTIYSNGYKHILAQVIYLLRDIILWCLSYSGAVVIDVSVILHYICSQVLVTIMRLRARVVLFLLKQ